MAAVTFLSIREYSKEKHLSKQTVRQLITAGKELEDGFKAVKVDSTWIIYRFN